MAERSFGSKLEYATTGSSTYTTVSNATSIGFPAPEIDEIEVTTTTQLVAIVSSYQDLKTVEQLTLRVLFQTTQLYQDYKQHSTLQLSTTGRLPLAVVQYGHSTATWLALVRATQRLTQLVLTQAQSVYQVNQHLQQHQANLRRKYVTRTQL